MYTSIDLGSHSIKIIVVSKTNGKFNVLASTNVRSRGIKKGLIKDKELALESLKEAINNINQDLGIPIEKVLVNFPLFFVNTSIETADLQVSGTVTGQSIQEVLKKVVLENIPKNKEVLYLEPIVFELDSDLQVVEPKGLSCDKLRVRCAVSVLEKDFLYDYLALLAEANLEVIDINYGVVNDYVQSLQNDIYKKLGVVVNLGYSKTEIAIFNKGIMLKGEIFPLGSSKIDKDLVYIYKVDKKTALMLKENFAVATSNYADQNDIMEVTNISGDKVNVNQFEVSQIVEARLKENIKSVKNEINNLTNREISYIIITGGITNLTGFSYLVKEEFQEVDTIVSNMTTLGIRNNIYSGNLGIIKYFDNKMNFRELNYSMFSESQIEELTTKKKKVSTKDNLLAKFSLYKKS